MHGSDGPRRKGLQMGVLRLIICFSESCSARGLSMLLLSFSEFDASAPVAPCLSWSDWVLLKIWCIIMLEWVPSMRLWLCCAGKPWCGKNVFDFSQWLAFLRRFCVLMIDMFRFCNFDHVFGYAIDDVNLAEPAGSVR